MVFRSYTVRVHLIRLHSLGNVLLVTVCYGAKHREKKNDTGFVT